MKRILIVTAAISVIAWYGCDTKAAKKETGLKEIHNAEIRDRSGGLMYVDRVSCDAVLQEQDTAGSNTEFHCYLVGFVDSSVVAKAADKQSEEAGKYFQYKMDKDWSVLVNGDSTKPVFFQPKNKHENHRNEGVIVFEVPKNKTQDTLVYNDSYGSWSTQEIIISSNNQ